MKQSSRWSRWGVVGIALLFLAADSSALRGWHLGVAAVWVEASRRRRAGGGGGVRAVAAGRLGAVACLAPLQARRVPLPDLLFRTPRAQVPGPRLHPFRPSVDRRDPHRVPSRPATLPGGGSRPGAGSLTRPATRPGSGGISSLPSRPTPPSVGGGRPGTGGDRPSLGGPGSGGRPGLGNLGGVEWRRSSGRRRRDSAGPDWPPGWWWRPPGYRWRRLTGRRCSDFAGPDWPPGSGRR